MPARLVVAGHYTIWRFISENSPIDFAQEHFAFFEKFGLAKFQLCTEFR